MEKMNKQVNRVGSINQNLQAMVRRLVLIPCSSMAGLLRQHLQRSAHTHTSWCRSSIPVMTWQEQLPEP
jgi:CRISPR/Cas system CSM-associated protein Csm3 (group 7 of RAMP superfamily)